MNKYSYLGDDNIVLHAIIGSFCSIGSGCKIGAANHSMSWVSTSPVFSKDKNVLRTNFSTNVYYPYDKKVIIGNDVWIGNKVNIKSGVNIGDGAVIGMGSVVTKNVGNYEVWAGNPAQLIKKRFSSEIINDLNIIKWWNFNNMEIKRYAKYFNNVELFILKYKEENGL